MFGAPYNYPLQSYKTNPASPYPTNVDNSPFQKRDLMEVVMMGNVSDPIRDDLPKVVEPADEATDSGYESADSDFDDPNEVDCNACDIVVDDKDAATYVNPAYAQASREAEQPDAPVTSTTIVVEVVTTTLPPSRAGFRVEVREPIETAMPQS